MDEENRKKKGSYGVAPMKSPRNSGQEQDSEMFDKVDRRSQKSVTLSPPDHDINRQVLLESYVQKEVMFAGVISDVQIDDVTNRTDMLRIIDKGKKCGVIPQHVSYEDHMTLFTLSVHNIKISQWGSPEELFLRIPMHEIAAVCYIKDDSQHILPIKYGIPERCNLAVLYVDNKAIAEEICALVDQCFQLVYTEAAMQFIDDKLGRVLQGNSIPSSTTQSDSTTINNQSESMFKPSFLTGSNVDLQTGSSSSYPRTSPKRSNTRTFSVTTESELSTSAYFELLQDYMRKLHKKLSVEELREFAVLLRAWHTDMPFNEFCEKVLALYGQERKHLLAGMCPFTPEKDYSFFVDFLTKNGVTLPENNGQGTISSLRSYSRLCSHSVSDAAMASNSVNGGDLDEFDRMLDYISDEIDHLDSSVDMNTNPDSFMP